jgi:type IV pilus assembly protein PilC
MNHLSFSNEQTGSLCQRLALLLHAGIGAADALDLLSGEEPDAQAKALYTSLAHQVDEGTSLATAMGQCGCFPNYLCALLEMGERAGRTEEALHALAHHYENRARLDRRLRSALLYPAILLLIMLSIIVVLLVEVLPVFNQVYAYLGGRLTGVAAGLLAFGQVLDGAMPVLCLLLAAAVGLLVAFAVSLRFRSWVLSAWRKRWGDRGVSRKLLNASFAQSLSMGLSSGLPLEEALSLSASLLREVPSAQARCADCLHRLEQGAPLAQAMSASGVLPQSQCRLLDLGLRSGSGDGVMEEIARRLTEESEAALEERVAQVEPALVLLTSILVGIILLSVMLPLMHIMTAIG